MYLGIWFDKEEYLIWQKTYSAPACNHDYFSFRFWVLVPITYTPQKSVNLFVLESSLIHYIQYRTVEHPRLVTVRALFSLYRLHYWGLANYLSWRSHATDMLFRIMSALRWGGAKNTAEKCRRLLQQGYFVCLLWILLRGPLYLTGKALFSLFRYHFTVFLFYFFTWSPFFLQFSSWLAYTFRKVLGVWTFPMPPPPPHIRYLLCPLSISLFFLPFAFNISASFFSWCFS
jgi:hypothetical protein